MYKFPHELPNKSRFTILENEGTSRKYLKCFGIKGKWLIIKCWRQFCFIMNILTSINAELQINIDLMTLQLIPISKPLQIITYKDSSTNTIEEGNETFVHVVIQSLMDHINSLENQLKVKQKAIEGLFNLNSCRCSCNPANGNH